MITRKIPIELINSRNVILFGRIISNYLVFGPTSSFYNTVDFRYKLIPRDIQYKINLYGSNDVPCKWINLLIFSSNLSFLEVSRSREESDVTSDPRWSRLYQVRPGRVKIGPTVIVGVTTLQVWRFMETKNIFFLRTTS